MASHIFKKNRSFFWFCIRDNDNGSYNFIVSCRIKKIFEYHFPDVPQAAPKGWEQSNNQTFSLWIPANNLWMINIQRLSEWAHFAGNQCVWLPGDGCLDFCIAGDFNFEVSEILPWPRTPLGEAEYSLKYQRSILTEEIKNSHINNVLSSMMACYSLLPLTRHPTHLINAAVSSIPDNGEPGKLAAALAWQISKRANLPFLHPILSSQKPSMKNLSQEDKRTVWNNLLSTDEATNLSSTDISGKEIIIIDDLYQSGATMQAYAAYLKRLGAVNIWGLVCVKSMRNTDNQ